MFLSNKSKYLPNSSSPFPHSSLVSDQKRHKLLTFLQAILERRSGLILWMGQMSSPYLPQKEHAVHIRVLFCQPGNTSTFYNFFFRQQSIAQHHILLIHISVQLAISRTTRRGHLVVIENN